MKKMIGNISKFIYLVVLTIVAITILTKSFILYGFISLFISPYVGLTAELFNKKKRVMIIFHTMSIILSLFVLWIWISSDIVPTMINF